MIQAFLKTALLLATLLVLGPLAASLAAPLSAPNGYGPVTPLTSTTPVKAIVLTMAAFGIAAMAGLVGCRFFGRGVGLTWTGLTLAWAAWSQGTTRSIFVYADTGSPLMKLAGEAVIVGLASVLTAWAVLAVSKARVRDDGLDVSLRSALGRPSNVLASVIGLAAAGIAAWLFAYQSAKGQTVLAGVAGGIGAGAATYLASSGMRHATTSLISPFLSLALLSIAAPLVGVFGHGPAFEAAALADSMIPLVRPVPMDWAAGAFIGIPIGMSWAGSMIET
jgi:hypothetical protein